MEQTENTPYSYRKLFIYYLEGKVRETCYPLGEFFIGNWEEGSSSFLFFSRPSLKRVTDLVRTIPGLTLADHYRMDYDQWQHGPFCPFTIGDISFSYPRISSASEGGVHHLYLDPGLVFGSGTHPTTRHCIDAIQQAFKNKKIKNVADLGTGSGILALVCAALGGERVVAVDINGLCTKTALENVRLNRLASQVLVVKGDAENFMDLPWDLMVSNIHYDVMKRLLLSESFLIIEQFILSGLLRSEYRSIEDILTTLPVQIIKTYHSDNTWYTIYGRTCGW